MQNRRKKHPQKVQIKIKEGQYKSIRWILILLFLQHFYYLTFTFCELGVFLFIFWVVFFAHASHCWSFSGKNSYYSRTFKNDNILEGNLYINPNMNNNSEESEPQTQWVKAFLLRLIYGCPFVSLCPIASLLLSLSYKLQGERHYWDGVSFVMEAAPLFWNSEYFRYDFLTF